MIGKSFLHYLGVLLWHETSHSQTTPKEREAIERYAKGQKLAVEIGVYEGVNTVVISRSIDVDGIVYGIDPFFKGKMGISYHKWVTKLNISRSGCRKKVTLVEKLSFDAINDVPNELDFIFIDGDHSFEGIKRDWHDWSMKLKKGGIILLHDTSIPEHDNTVSQLGSFKYYNEYIHHEASFKHLETIDSLNVLQKMG